MRQGPLTPAPSPPEGARGERNKDCQVVLVKAAHHEDAPQLSALFTPPIKTDKPSHHHHRPE